MENFLELLGLLIVFGAILVLSYFTTVFIGKRFSGGSKNKHMKIVETLSLGIDRGLYLILIGNRYFLFLSSKKGLELVTEVELEEQASEEQTADEKAAATGFMRIFESYSGLSRRTDQEKENGQDGEAGDKAEDPGKGIHGSIKRLKKINDRNN